jgi:hypothetical protein
MIGFATKHPRPPHSSLPRVILAAALLASWGCRSTLESGSGVPPQVHLKPDPKFYVTEPADWQPGRRREPSSGRGTAHAMVTSLDRVMRRVSETHPFEPFTNSVVRALEKQCEYLVQTEILDWSEHRTENTGMRDQVTVRITLYALPEATPLFSTVRQAKSRWYGASDEDKVPDLLQELFLVYARQLKAAVVDLDQFRE